MENENKNTMKGMMKSNYGDNKLDKSSELNENMSIAPSSMDEYSRTIHNIGGRQNG